MGSSKALLPLGSLCVLERVVGVVRRAGVDEIVVVTGHEAERLAPVLERLSVRVVHNEGYDRGMFSSVWTGVGALPLDTRAFFVFPVDYALVRPAVLERLMAAFSPERHGALHPCCCGRRGHPPLISGRCREELLLADDRDGLEGFLKRTVEDQAEVEVADATILMDMDTVEDHERMLRFAATIEAGDPTPGDGGAVPAGGSPGATSGDGGSMPVGGGPGPAPGKGGPVPVTAQAPAGGSGRPDTPAPRLSPEDALYLLGLLGSPEEVVVHCRAVAEVAAVLAGAIKPLAPGLDVELAYTGGLLHDMARSCQRHALVGREILANLGLVRLAEVVGAHMILPPEQVRMTRVTEEQLVYLADKLVIGDRVGSLEDRAARTLVRLGEGGAPAEALAGMEERMQMARAIQEKVEGVLGRGLSEVLP
jgi:CTP:molybdopterin cytidylyltransferase MocA